MGRKQQKKDKKHNLHAQAQESKRDERKNKREFRKKREKLEERLYNSDMTWFHNHLGNLGLKLQEMKGDGNCYFRAIADQMVGNENKHLEYR